MKYFLILVAASFFSTTLFAGPKDKNMKPWQKNAKAQKVVTIEKTEKITGAKAKNTAIEVANLEGETVAVNLNVEKEKLMGPKLKNQKNFSDPQPVIMIEELELAIND